jgi:ADP-heptose:LPS heptosyltransferase
VCNDSAPLHIAVGFSRPITAIFGPTNPALVGPYRREDSVVQPADADHLRVVNYRRFRNDQSLISKIGVEEVWKKIQEQLERHDIQLDSV